MKIILGIIALLAAIALWAYPSDSTAKVSTDDTFIIGLPSNPTTGYQWMPDFNSKKLKLVDQWYVQDSQPQREGVTDPATGISSMPNNEPLLGTGGIEYFEFKLKKPSATVTFRYMRSWEGKAIDTKVFKITER